MGVGCEHSGHFVPASRPPHPTSHNASVTLQAWFACSSLHFIISFLPAIDPAWNWLASSSCCAASSFFSAAFNCQHEASNRSGYDGRGGHHETPLLLPPSVPMWDGKAILQ